MTITDTMLFNKFKSLHKDKRNKASKMQKLIDLGILTWIAYNIVMIVYKVRIARAFLAYFPMAGR